MKVCRFQSPDNVICIGLADDDETVIDLTTCGVLHLAAVLDAPNPVALVRAALEKSPPHLPLAGLKLLAPVEQQEVWAAGVTYLRSKKARMEESDFSATAYDRVYEAARPEIFFKSPAAKVVATGEPVGIRADSRWNVPEPELALVLNSRGKVVGCAVANDMSSREIEGENLLYLPQAKIYHRSCALGPWITLGESEAAIRAWTISIAIRRAGATMFSGETSVGQIKRGFDELARYLFRSQQFPDGAVLLTGTGIVPADTFTLQPDDEIEITISGIGRLVNRVTLV